MLFATLFMLFTSVHATKTVTITRHMIGNDGSGNYEMAHRQMHQILASFEGVPVVQGYLINIDCFGTGNQDCPQTLVAPGDPIYEDADISNPALLSMQVKVDQKSLEGENGDYINESGTIITSLNEVIHYNVTWTIDSANNDIKMKIIFNLDV